MDAITELHQKMKQSGVTIYQLAKKSGMRYELLRRSLHRKRKLSADEYITLIAILDNIKA